VANNPDPTLTLTTSKGVSRTVDDWTTMFHLCLVVLAPIADAAPWIPIAQRIFATLGDADCRCAFLVPGNPQIAARLLGPVESTVLTFVDPDFAFVQSVGLEHLPAFVHLRQDATLGATAEGWHPHEWQQVANEVGAAMAWTVPEVSAPTDPRPTAGWAVSAL